MHSQTTFRVLTSDNTESLGKEISAMANEPALFPDFIVHGGISVSHSPDKLTEFQMVFAVLVSFDADYP